MHRYLPAVAACTLLFLVMVSFGHATNMTAACGPKDVSVSTVLNGPWGNRANGTGTSRDLERRAGTGDWASFGVNVERFDITALRADGVESNGPYTDALPVAVSIEIRIRDSKDRATIALTSSAFLPGGGF